MILWASGFFGVLCIGVLCIGRFCLCSGVAWGVNEFRFSLLHYSGIVPGAIFVRGEYY